MLIYSITTIPMGTLKYVLGSIPIYLRRCTGLPDLGKQDLFSFSLWYSHKLILCFSLLSHYQTTPENGPYLVFIVSPIHFHTFTLYCLPLLCLETKLSKCMTKYLLNPSAFSLPSISLSYLLTFSHYCFSLFFLRFLFAFFSFCQIVIGRVDPGITNFQGKCCECCFADEEPEAHME